MAPPEVWFRILHAASGSRDDVSEPAFAEQKIEIALGPKDAFEDESVGALRRRISQGLRP